MPPTTGAPDPSEGPSGTSRVIRRPQRTLTDQDRETIRRTAALNFQGALLMGIVDPVPNPSPMSEQEGAWVRETVWPEHYQVTERRYPFGFHRWSHCELGTCWNCLYGRCDLCVHRQQGGPAVDGNRDTIVNTRGHHVAQLIVRPAGEPCVWWCRCPCPKAGTPAPAPRKSRPAPPAPNPAAPAAAPTAPLSGRDEDAAEPPQLPLF